MKICKSIKKFAKLTGVSSRGALSCFRIKQSSKNCEIAATNGRVAIIKTWEDDSKNESEEAEKEIVKLKFE